MRLTTSFHVCFALCGLLSSVTLCSADTQPTQAEPEPTKEQCMAAADAARKLAEALPPGDGSRYFAERYLQQAMMEADNGEFDDCLEWAKRASEEVQQHRHALKPGESLNVRPANE